MFCSVAWRCIRGRHTRRVWRRSGGGGWEGGGGGEWEVFECLLYDEGRGWGGDGDGDGDGDVDVDVDVDVGGFERDLRRFHILLVADLINSLNVVEENSCSSSAVINHPKHQSFPVPPSHNLLPISSQRPLPPRHLHRPMKRHVPRHFLHHLLQPLLVPSL